MDLLPPAFWYRFCHLHPQVIYKQIRIHLSLILFSCRFRKSRESWDTQKYSVFIILKSILRLNWKKKKKVKIMLSDYFEEWFFKTWSTIVKNKSWTPFLPQKNTKPNRYCWEIFMFFLFYEYQTKSIFYWLLYDYIEYDLNALLFSWLLLNMNNFSKPEKLEKNQYF